MASSTSPLKSMKRKSFRQRDKDKDKEALQVVGSPPSPPLSPSGHRSRRGSPAPPPPPPPPPLPPPLMMTATTATSSAPPQPLSAVRSSSSEDASTPAVRRSSGPTGNDADVCGPEAFSRRVSVVRMLDDSTGGHSRGSGGSAAVHPLDLRRLSPAAAEDGALPGGPSGAPAAEGEDPALAPEDAEPPSGPGASLASAVRSSAALGNVGGTAVMQSVAAARPRGRGTPRMHTDSNIQARQSKSVGKKPPLAAADRTGAGKAAAAASSPDLNAVAQNRSAAQPSAAVPPASVGLPRLVKHVVHVDSNLEWSGIDPGTLFERIAIVGRGAYGTVWRGFQKQTRQPVAIKELHDLKNQDGLRREIEILRKCSHKNIVCYYGASRTEDGRLWIFMDYCDAGSLRDMIDTTGPLLEDQIAFVLQESIQGLLYLHSANIIHRDIKAGNILVDASGAVKIADFGVSQQLTTGAQGATEKIGSPLWMAPEVMQSREYDFRADIWSLGITAIELADGVPPNSAMSRAQIMRHVPKAAPPTLAEPRGHSKSFVDFVSRCLQKDPADRSDLVGLIMHPFLKNRRGPAVLAEPIALCMQRRAQLEAEAAETVAEKSASPRTATAVSVPNDDEFEECLRNNFLRKEKGRQEAIAIMDSLSSSTVVYASSSTEENRSARKNRDRHHGQHDDQRRQHREDDANLSGSDGSVVELREQSSSSPSTLSVDASSDSEGESSDSSSSSSELPARSRSRRASDAEDNVDPSLTTVMCDCQGEVVAPVVGRKSRSRRGSKGERRFERKLRAQADEIRRLRREVRKLRRDFEALRGAESRGSVDSPVESSSADSVATRTPELVVVADAAPAPAPLQVVLTTPHTPASTPVVQPLSVRDSVPALQLIATGSSQGASASSSPSSSRRSVRAVSEVFDAVLTTLRGELTKVQTASARGFAEEQSRAVLTLGRAAASLVTVASRRETAMVAPAEVVSVAVNALVARYMGSPQSCLAGGLAAEIDAVQRALESFVASRGASKA